MSEPIIPDPAEWNSTPASMMIGSVTESGCAHLKGETEIPIRSDSDILVARKCGRQLASELGFRSLDLTLIATVISELARNIVCYAKRGEIIICPVVKSGSLGLTITARDEGPGIWNIEQALQPGFTTSAGLGLGLLGVKRLMDEFDIVSKIGEGTIVKVTKWNR